MAVETDFSEKKDLVDSELNNINDVRSFVNRRFATYDGTHYMFMKIIMFLLEDIEKLHKEIDELKSSK